MTTDRNYVKRVARSLREIAEEESGEPMTTALAVRLVESNLDAHDRPNKREEFAAWLYDRVQGLWAMVERFATEKRDRAPTPDELARLLERGLIRASTKEDRASGPHVLTAAGLTEYHRACAARRARTP